MERLTVKTDVYQNGQYEIIAGMKCGVELKDIFDRLAAYEDTGLEPEEVRSQKELFDYLVFDSMPSEDIERFKRLRELAEADREGRCVVLPRLEPGQGDPAGDPGPQGPPGIAD